MTLFQGQIFHRFSFFFLLILMHCIPLAHSTDIQENVEIVREKVKQIGPNCYALNATYNNQPLCCLYEKLSSENDKFWCWFADTQSSWAQRKIVEYKHDDKKLEYARGLCGGAMGFGGVLANHDSCEVWCSYICTDTINNPSKSIPNVNLSIDLVKSEVGCAGIDNIEMVVGVATSSEVPFYTHMGISRSIYRQHHNMSQQVKNTSNLLHVFSSFMQDYLNPKEEKPYMITQPLKHMRKMLITGFPNNIYIGDNRNFKVQGEYIEKFQSEDAQEIVQQYKEHPSVIQIDDGNNFILLKDNKTIWKVPIEKHWFFDVVNNSIIGDPYVVLDRPALINFFIDAIEVRK